MCASIVTLDSMYFMMVALCLAFFVNVGLCQFQDTSSCDYGESECQGYDGYICEGGTQCIYCGALLYNYNCDSCECEIGSLGFILLCIGIVIVIVASIFCCKKCCCKK